MDQAVDPIGAGAHQLARDVIDAVPGGLHVASQVIHAVPPGDVVARRDGAPHQVPHPPAFAVFDHQRDEARPVEMKAKGNRGMFHGFGRGVPTADSSG